MRKPHITNWIIEECFIILYISMLKSICQYLEPAKGMNCLQVITLAAFSLVKQLNFLNGNTLIHGEHSKFSEESLIASGISVGLPEFFTSAKEHLTRMEETADLPGNFLVGIEYLFL